MTKKHFIAIHNETGERIEFGVDDIWVGIVMCLFNNEEFIEIGRNFVEFLSDHTLYYLHQGKYYNYETQEEMG